MVRRCVARGQGDDGIALQLACDARGNLLHTNGLSGGSGAGLLAAASLCRIEANEAVDNGYGFRLTGSANRAMRNFASSNSLGDYSFDPVLEDVGPVVTGIPLNPCGNVRQ